VPPTKVGVYKDEACESRFDNDQQAFAAADLGSEGKLIGRTETRPS